LVAQHLRDFYAALILTRGLLQQQLARIRGRIRLHARRLQQFGAELQQQFSPVHHDETAQR